MRLYLVASKPTDAVTYGFLPAAARLGLDVTVLTDRPAAHASAYEERLAPPPLAEETAEYPVPRIEYRDVTDHRALIAAIEGKPAGIFTNSDRLQEQTALAAVYLGLPGKDWRSALRAKRKPLMRSALAAAGIERVRVAEVGRDTPAGDLEYPVVLKPADGVASEDVVLAEGPRQLEEFRDDYFRRHTGGTLMAEEFLPGTLRTLETLGDGETRWVLGGFRTTVSKPPFFAEERLDWEPPAPGARAHAGAALDALGASFGACHTEYMDGDGIRLIEVNDRAIGDHCEFLLAHLTGLPLFELILRVHLGERLPGNQPAPPPGREHAVADYVFADGPGRLAKVPPAIRRDRAGVALAHWPLCRAGDKIDITRTNRDYLGVLLAAGSDPVAIEDAVLQLRASLDYRMVA